MHLGENVVNRWNTLPVVNIEGEVGIPWQQNKLEAENAGHIRTFIRYKNPKMQDGALILEGGFEHDQILSYRPELDRHPLQSLKRQNPHTDFRPITSLSSLLKKRIAANFKMIVCLPGEIQSHLGIDLLQGNIYMSSQAISKVYPYIPLTERGRVHIDLKKVIDPLHIDTFFINGYPLELNHRQALQILIDQISPQFKLPSDTYDNILLVCQHVDEFFSVLATAPLTMLKEEYQDIQKINSCYAQFMHKLEQAKKASRSSKVPPHIQELVRQVSPIIERIKLALDESDHLLLKKSIKEFFKAQK
jgi:hypothetical protein